MPVPLAELIVALSQVYALAGVAFAPFFVIRGVGRLDPLARGAGWGFRLLIVPGSVLFWPLLLMRWRLGSEAPPVESNAHRRGSLRRP